MHIIGPRATELIAEAVLALRLECTVEELVKTIHAHPTMSEAVGEAAHALRMTVRVDVGDGGAAAHGTLQWRSVGPSGILKTL